MVKPAAVKIQLAILIIDKTTGPYYGEIKVGPYHYTIFKLHVIEGPRLLPFIFCQLAAFKPATVKTEVAKPAIDENGVFENSIVEPAIIKTAVSQYDIAYFSRGEIVVLKFSLSYSSILEFSRHSIQ